MATTGAGEAQAQSMTQAELDMVQGMVNRHKLEYGELRLRVPVKSGDMQEARLDIEHVVRRESKTRRKQG